MTQGTYVMTEMVLKRITSMHGECSCDLCKKAIKPNQKVVAKKTGSYKIYHEKCRESLFLDV